MRRTKKQGNPKKQGKEDQGFAAISGRPRFGSVRLRFGDGTVRAVLVFGSRGSSAKKGFSVFPYPKNLFGLFLTFRVLSILQGYFWRPSENTL